MEKKIKNAQYGAGRSPQQRMGKLEENSHDNKY